MPLPLLAWSALLALGGGVGYYLRHRKMANYHSPASGGPTMPLIKLGSTGEAVSVWRVSVLKLSPGTTFDAETDVATKAWQKAHDLAADGIVGRMSWQAAGYQFQAPPRTPSAPSPVASGAASSSLDASAAAAGETTAGGGDGGHEWARTLPLEGTSAQGTILAAFNAGHYVHTWVPLTLTHGSDTLEIEVSARALRIGTHDDSVSVIVTPATLQAMADTLDAYMLTSHVSEAIHRAADLQILPYPGRNNWVQDGTMGHTDRMVEHSDALDAKGVLSANLVSNEGKDWITSLRFWTDPEKGAANRHNDANFGFFQDTNGHPVQTIGLRHKGHTDYSQKARFMKRIGRLNGSTVDLRDIVRDNSLFPLLSDEGRMPDLRHPDAGGAQS